MNDFIDIDNGIMIFLDEIKKVEDLQKILSKVPSGSPIKMGYDNILCVYFDKDGITSE